MKKIIKASPNHGVPVYERECPVCGCVFEFTQDEVAEEYSDPRDGSRYWSVECPDCKKTYTAFMIPNPIRYEKD